MPKLVRRLVARTSVALLAVATFALLTGAEPAPADVHVELGQPFPGPVSVVDFELGSNELHDIFIGDGIARAREIGLDSVRVWLGHRFLTAAVRSPTAFDFDWDLLFDYVARVLAAGARPHVSFVAALAWILAPDGRPSSQHESEVLSPQSARAYGEYVAAAIQQLQARFGDQALDWRYVIWNEPNNHQNAGQGYACGSGEAYAALFAEARAATDQRFGRGRIALGGPSLDAIDTGATLDASGSAVCGGAPDHDWQTYLSSVDALTPFDFLTWHWYGMFQIGRASPQEVLTTRLGWFEDRVRSITEVANGRPHYVEEINYNGDLAADPLINTQVNAAFIASATLRAVRQGASGIMVYKGTRGPGGLTPRGEPDFGLWSSDPNAPPSPAFHALQLLRRVVTDGSRLVHTEVYAKDLDALAIVRDTGPALALVNLSDRSREVRITGLSAGRAIHVNDVALWRTDWFDGQSIGLRPYGVAVITAGAARLSTLPIVASGAAAYAMAGATPACATCHGFDGQDGPAPSLHGAGANVVNASHAAGTPGASEIATFLAGLGANDHLFVGRITDAGGAPIEGALVLADYGEFGPSVFTDADGRYELRATHGDSGPFAATPTLRAQHPAYRASREPAHHEALAPGRTEIDFELAARATDEGRPLLASAHVVPHQAPGVPAGAWTVGVATAGTNLTVWAVDRDTGRAVRLAAVHGHPFGLFDAQIGALDPTADERHWTFVAIAPSGATSRYAELGPA